MAYEILGYDHISNTFKSHAGYETAVTIKYDENYGKVGSWNFADIDCDFISLHHYLKWQSALL